MTLRAERRPLHVFLRDIDARIIDLRRRLQAEVVQHAKTLEDAWKLSGRVYVASIGTIVEVVNHETEFFYLPAILPARDQALSVLAGSRDSHFNAIAASLESHQRILIVGAGGDVTPVNSLRDRGHDVICTDFAQDVVDIIHDKADVPAFACDLVYLNDVLPEPLDIIVGNSTLGYVAPRKLATVCRNLVASMHRGGIFTFDLKPHGDYFNMALDARTQTVANEAAPSPQALFQHIQRHGISKGIAAAALEDYLVSIAISLAVVEVLRRQFEDAGAKCMTSQYSLRTLNGQQLNCFTIRVSRDDASILAPVRNEVPYENPEVALRSQDLRGFHYMPFFLDRGTGQEIAKQLGIHRNLKEDPWLVLDYLKQHDIDHSHYAALMPELASGLDPNKLADRIQEYMHGRPYLAPAPLPAAVLVDQNTRKFAITTEIMSREMADARIDLAYQRAAVNPTLSATELGRPPLPHELRRLVAAPEPKVGRNVPCPCGSGVKYKKCHGR